MAFKGTNKIGTKNYEKEKAALERVETAYAAYDKERRKPVGRDEAKVAQLEKSWKSAIDEANKYVEPNEFSKIVDRAGAAGVNASTFPDKTAYYYSFPSNRVELWAYLESERFIHPVFREFYTERNVVTEERRMRTESNPIGRLVEQFLGTAFTAHAYRQPGVGWPSDLQTFSATDAAAYYKKYYVPSNMVIALVGDLKASETIPVIEKYFSRLPKGTLPPENRTVEPPQIAERRIVIRDQSQPIYLEGYHRPAITDKDNAIYDVMEILMSDGRTSRMYRALVRDKKLAVNAAGFNGFPGSKYPNLFAVFAIPTPGHTAQDMMDPIHAEIDRLKNEDVSAEELQSVKTKAKAELIRQLDSNAGMAFQLADYQTLFGDWRELFREVDEIDRVTAADIRRVANALFVPSNRTVGLIESTRAAAAKAPSGGTQ
jgi:predicted Zn-dependent peptidase